MRALSRSVLAASILFSSALAACDATDTQPSDHDQKTCKGLYGELNICTFEYPEVGSFSCAPQPVDGPGCLGKPGEPADAATASYPIGCRQFLGWCNPRFPCSQEYYECYEIEAGKPGRWLIPS